jgi:hypothetical protein
MPGPLDIDIMISAWGFRQSHSKTEYEFLDTQKRPLDVLAYTEGDLHIQDARQYVLGLTTEKPSGIVHEDLHGARRVAVLLRADFARCTDFDQCRHWIGAFNKEDLPDPEKAHQQIVQQTVSSYDQRISMVNERAMLAIDDDLALADVKGAGQLFKVESESHFSSGVLVGSRLGGGGQQCRRQLRSRNGDQLH